MQSSTLRSKDRNILLYNESARPLPAGQLAQYKDVDLAVESQRAKGLTEKKAVATVAEELISQWTDLTSIKVSHLSSVIRKINGLRNSRYCFHLSIELEYINSRICSLFAVLVSRLFLR